MKLTSTQTLPRPALAQIPKLRLGNVAYLNSVPLTWGWEEAFRFEHPAVLAEQLASGELEGGLAPLYALLDAERYALVDGVGICANGPVYSVGVIAPTEFGEFDEVLLTTASRSSRNLLKVLLAEFYPHAIVAFGEVELPEVSDPNWHKDAQALLTSLQGSGRAVLVIGDRALAMHEQLPAGGGMRFHDLGELWLRHTGLPFVFAMWGLKIGLGAKVLQATAMELRELAAYGLAHRREIAGTAPALIDPGLAFRYLTEHIHFQVGSDERAGAAEFLRLLKKHALLPPTAEMPQFV